MFVIRERFYAHPVLYIIRGIPLTVYQLVQLIRFENKYTVTSSSEILEYYLFYRKLAPTASVTSASHVVETTAVGNGISFSSF